MSTHMSARMLAHMVMYMPIHVFMHVSTHFLLGGGAIRSRVEYEAKLADYRVGELETAVVLLVAMVDASKTHMFVDGTIRSFVDTSS